MIRSRSFFDSLILSALRRRYLVLVLSAFLMITGFIQLQTMNVDIFPPLNKPAVTVLVEAHGRAAVEVEQQVTIPLETHLQGILGLEEIRADSQKGLATLKLYFPWGSDVFLSRQLVAERLSFAAAILPPHTDIILAPVSSIMGEILQVGILAGDQQNPRELYDSIQYNLKKRLQAVPGVSVVIMHGALVPEYQIILNPKQLQRYDVSIHQIEHHLEAIGLSTSGGFFERNGQEFVIRNSGHISSLSDLEEAFIGDQYGVPLKVKNIAVVQERFKPRIGDAGIDGSPAIILTVQKQPGISTIQVTEQLLQICNEFQQQVPQVEIRTDLFQQASFIEISIRNILEALQEGALIIVCIIALFLWNLRSTMVTLCSLPLTFILSINLLELFGFSINTMTLAGLTIAIGELVDDSIVDVENIHRHLRENPRISGKEKLRLVFLASSQVRNSIVLATLVVVVVFVPLVLLPGLAGKLFFPLAVSYVIALASSLIVALTIVPTLSFFFVKVGKLDSNSPLASWIKNSHQSFLQKYLGKKFLAFGLITGFTIVAVFLFFRLELKYMPQFNEGALTVELFARAGTGLEKSKSIAQTVENLILSYDEVQSVVRRTGRAEFDEHVSQSSDSEFEIILKPGINRDQLYQKIETALNQIPDINYLIGQPISHRIDHMLTGVKTDAAIFLYGEEVRALSFAAYAITQKLKKVEEINNPYSGGLKLVPELRIRPDPERLSRALIPMGEFMHTMETALNGRILGSVYAGEKKYGVRLRLPERWRGSTGQLERLPLGYRTNGSVIYLSQVADVYEAKGPAVLKRLNGFRFTTIQFNLGNSPEQAIKEARTITDETLNQFPGIRYEMKGRYFDQQQSFQVLKFILMGSVFILFLILYIYFRSWFSIFQMIILMPLSFAGGLLGLHLSGISLSSASLVGFIALVGISSRNSILLLSSFWDSIRSTGELKTSNLIRSANNRLIPVLMTALSTSLALIPILWLGPDSPGQELLYPIAVVITGGLICSTVLEILVSPSLFYFLAKRFYQGKLND